MKFQFSKSDGEKIVFTINKNCYRVIRGFYINRDTMTPVLYRKNSFYNPNYDNIQNNSVFRKNSRYFDYWDQDLELSPITQTLIDLKYIILERIIHGKKD